MNVGSGLVLSDRENGASVRYKRRGNSLCACCNLAETSTILTETEGLYIQPQTHTDCTRDCNVEWVIFYFTLL